MSRDAPGRSAAEINETAASVLGFLSLGPLTGWDLDALAQHSVGNFWSVTRSQVYRELKALEELGLVDGEDAGARGRRRYRLTPQGRAALHEWLRRPPGEETTRNRFLVRLFFADGLSEEELAALVHEARSRHERDLARYEGLLADAEALSPFAAATVHYGIAVERAVLAWFAEEPWARDRPEA